MRTASLDLSRDERGAFMVAGIFMMLFLVAALYTVIGIARTLLLRDGMQDAADAAAFSSAIFHARGMNLIAFINIIMAALMAVLVALKLTETLFRFASYIALGLVWLAGAGAALSVTLQQFAEGFATAYRTSKEVVMPILSALHQAERVTSVVVPWVASVDGMMEAAKYHEPAKGAFTPPRRAALPVAVDRFDRLCGKATSYAVDTALTAALIVPKFVRKKLSNAAEEMGEKTSKFLCGDGSSSPPTYTDTIKREYPPLPGAEVCKSDPGSNECQALEDKVRRSTPDEDYGKCQEDCGHQGAYELRARDARFECQPQPPSFSPSQFLWQRHKVHVTYTHDGNQWQVTKRVLDHKSSRLEETTRPPCGERGTLNEDEWQPFSGPEGPNYPDPLCTKASDAPKSAGKVNESFTILTEQATRIFSCSIEVEQTVSLANKEDALGGSGSEGRSPHKVEDDLELGAEAFQIRALAFGDKPGPGQAKAGVALADPRRQERQDSPQLLGSLANIASEAGRFSIAQAEYFYDHSGGVPREEWLWNMAWSARLKRFRMPSPEEQADETKRRERSNADAASALGEFGVDAPAKSPGAACHDAGAEGCESSGSALSFLDSLVLH